MNDGFFLYKDGIATDIQLKPFLFELAMEGYLADNPTILTNKQLGLEDAEVMAVEETIGKSGRIDVLLRYSNDSIAVVELKNVLATTKALKQLVKYLKEKHKSLCKDNEGDETTPIIGILVAPELDEQVISDIETGNTDGFKIYGVELLRYYDQSNWYITTKWYSSKATKGKKDYTKYTLSSKPGLLFGKGRLVYAIIEDYLYNHPGITSRELKNVFQDSLRNTKTATVKHHVVELESKVLSVDRFARYFKNPLMCVDGAVVVSSQWGIGNINQFIDYAKTLGYIIDIVNNK